MVLNWSLLVRVSLY